MYSSPCCSASRVAIFAGDTQPFPTTISPIRRPLRSFSDSADSSCWAVSKPSRTSRVPMGRRVSAERTGLAGRGKGRFVAAASKLPISDYRPGSMRAVCQRVTKARVRVGGEVVGEIGLGLCVLLGIACGDSETERFAGKIARLRIFPDAEGRFDRRL